MAPVLRAWHTGQADRAGVMPSVEHYAYLMYTKPRSPSSVHKQAARHRTGDYPNFRELRTSELLRIPNRRSSQNSTSRQSGEWGSKEGPEHQEAPTLTAEHVPSGQLVLSSLLSCGLSRPFCRPF